MSRPPVARAVLFDLDGTLLDTLEDIARSANQALQRLGGAAHPPDAYRMFIGDGVANLFRRALPPETADTERIERCVEEFREAYSDGWNVATRPYDGIPELLDALVARGLDMAVLSNKPDAFTRRCVEEYLGRWPFRVVFGDRAGIARKPDPAGALEIASVLGIPCDAMVYLGDSSVDMATARRSGMYPVGAAWGFRPIDELWSSGAAAVIDRPLDLLRILDEDREPDPGVV